MPFCEVLPHPADLKIRLRAKNWDKLVTCSAKSFSFLVLDSENFLSRPAKTKIKIKFKGRSKEEQLVNFFNDLIFIFDTKRLLPQGGKVLADVFEGWFFEVQESEVKERIKSATFYQLRIKKVKTGLEAEVVFDV